MNRAFVGLLMVLVIAVGTWIFRNEILMAAPADNDTVVEPSAIDTPSITDPAAPIQHSDSDDSAMRVAASENAAPSGAPAPAAGADQMQDEGATGGSPSGAPAAPENKGAQGAAAGAQGGNPTELAKTAEKGSLKSPYADYKTVAEEGHQKFMSAGCNGCHGGTGGGGMGPPLTNEVWVYGKDDDTLFRLIALGSDELKKQGYTRKGSENVVGPMPPMGGVLKSPDDEWKIIAWIRSVNPSSAGAAPSASAAPAAPAQQ
jgi:hypothetical protein